MIEIIHIGAEAPEAHSVVFDFDGTVSLIRSGWAELMTAMMLETADGLLEQSAIEDLIMRLTGKETIYQIQAFADAVHQRGGTPPDPQEYLRLFLERLGRIIGERIEGLRRGATAPDDLLVPGVRALLEELRGRGLVLYLASGTNEICVKQESVLLDIARYFDGGIFGAVNGGSSFSKRALMERITMGSRGRPGRIVGFGDGRVEIEEVKRVNGVAVGVATSEPECHVVAEGKRRHLIEAGADYIVPNYLGSENLLRSIFPS